MKGLRLRVQPQNVEGYTYACEKDSVVLGRSSKADVAIPDLYLSRLHARVFRKDGQWWVEDLGSRNTTLLNGRPVREPAKVGPGDVLKLSDTLVTLLDDERPRSSEDIPTDTLFRSASALLEKSGPVESIAASGAESLRRYAERLHTLNEVHRALAAPLSLEQLLQLILDRAFALLKPEEGAVFLRRPDGSFEMAAERRLPGLSGESLYSRRLISEVTEKGMAALVTDASMDERFSEAVSIRLSGIRSLVAAPLLHADGCVGMIALNSRALVRQFSEEDMELLVSLAHVAGLRIQNIALAEEAVRRQALEKELDLARRIQVGLLTAEPPTARGWEVLGASAPSRTVSGDLYQVKEREGGECVFLVADVSGKGMSAALLTASLEALAAGPIESGFPPDEIFSKLSRRLHARTTPERFATGFLGILSPESGRLRYANAGHNPPLWVRGGGAVARLGSTGLPLGLLPNGVFRSAEVELEPGDTLVVYTDGITEATDPEDQEYGLQRLETVAVTHAKAPLDELRRAIEQDLEAFVRGVPYGDDRTLLLVRRTAA